MFLDRFFASFSKLAGFIILAILLLVALFLVWQSIPAFLADSSVFEESGASSFWGYVWPLTFGTLWAAFLAMFFAVPVALGVALFLTQYVNRRVSAVFSYLVDLLAAIPSVVYGLWGIMVLAPAVQPVYVWFNEKMGWFPLFAGPVSGTGRTIFTAAIVLAVMVLPIITALSREVFSQTPRLQVEASLALGATKWESIKLSVLPYGRSGVVSASMLGLGRALGETMAVATVLSPGNVVSFALFTSENPSTIAANIALNFPESFGVNINVLIATGLVLFVITFLVNSISRVIVSRSGLKG